MSADHRVDITQLVTDVVAAGTVRRDRGPGMGTRAEAFSATAGQGPTAGRSARSLRAMAVIRMLAKSAHIVHLSSFCGEI